MPKWDIDRALKLLEPETAPGTSITRVMAEVDFMRLNGVVPTPEQIERGFGHIWCVGLGFLHRPKAFIYGHTIRQTVLRARKLAKGKQLASATAWGVQDFQPKFKAKRKDDRHGKPKKKSPRAGAVA